AAAEVAAAAEALAETQALAESQAAGPAGAARAAGPGTAGPAPGTIDLTSRRSAAAEEAGPAPGRRMRLVPTGAGAGAGLGDLAPGPTPEQAQAEAKARLAAAVAELARHVATTQADERIDAELLEQQHREEEARRRAEEAAAAEQRRRAAEALLAARGAVRGGPRRWLGCAVVAAAVLVPLALDVRSPMATRSRLAEVARAAAAGAAVQMSEVDDEALARRAAQGVADLEGVRLERFSIARPTITVTVGDRADSFLLGRLVPRWYEVEASASADALVAGANP
ncbi:MAG: hypothetical protein ACLGIO_02675, partial [Acidimicrobiia bacterium]